MKLPDALSGLKKDKLLELVIRYGDKAVLAIVAVLSCGLAWGGLDALRSKTASPARQPRAIEQAAAMAETHIGRLQSPPQSVRVKPEPLAGKVEPWQSPKLATASSQPLFDQPLFEELAKRTKPDVFPIERLQATAGIAVLAVGDRPSDAGAGAAAAPPPRGRITPFAVVTGLVPHDKQVEEYRRRFTLTSYPDPKRDSPLWSDYLVERTEVNAGGQENWQRMDPKLLAKKAREEWAGVQGETLPSGIFMPSGREASQAASFSGYCLPLPQLAAGSWGPETMHSSFIDIVKEAWAKQPAAAQPARPQSGLQVPEERASARPDFTGSEEQGAGASAEVRPATAADPGRSMQPGGQPYRLFRFVDTTVQMGRSYRYRVRLSVWNPNWKLPARHLSDPAIAANDRLASNATEPSATVSVPTATTVLARSLSKADMKRFKPGMVEALVLGESRDSGSYAIRSVITETGGLVNVDSRLNKPGDTRARGEDIVTDAVVVDVRGRQHDRGEERAGGRAPQPPEPFELLVLKPDGSFAVASVPDSEALILENLATLPVIESPVKSPAALPGGPPGAAPGGLPFPASPF